MNVLEDPNQKFLKEKLAFKDTVNVSDEQAEEIFTQTIIESQSDLEILLGYLEQFRPEIIKKLAREI